jgi:hypothetical protein
MQYRMRHRAHYATLRGGHCNSEEGIHARTHGLAQTYANERTRARRPPLHLPALPPTLRSPLRPVPCPLFPSTPTDSMSLARSVSGLLPLSPLASSSSIISPTVSNARRRASGRGGRERGSGCGGGLKGGEREREREKEKREKELESREGEKEIHRAGEREHSPLFTLAHARARARVRTRAHAAGARALSTRPLAHMHARVRASMCVA